MVRWKENRGEKWSGGKIFRAEIRKIFRAERRYKELRIKIIYLLTAYYIYLQHQRWKDFQGKGGNFFV